MTPEIKKDAGRLKHPRGFWFIFWGELAERSSYYGMRGLLALYLTAVLGFTDASAGVTISLFIATCYILPLLGGYIADRWLGKFRTILYFSFPYILGHILIGGLQDRFWLYAALLLLALGSGSIKPNLSPLMGIMYEREGKQSLLTQAFSWYYVAINIGAAFSMLVLPYVRDHYGYAMAFAIPAVLMVIALAIFAKGRKYYPAEAPRALPKKTPDERREERQVLAKLAGVFLLITFFWSIFDQSATTWIFFARDHMTLSLFGLPVSADALQGINPFLIIVLTPFFNWLWKASKKRRGIEPRSTQKMMLGFVLVFLCMATMALAGFLAAAGKVSVWWEVVAYLMVTMAELCVSVVGLEFAFTQAPARMKSMVTAAFLFTVFLGNLLAGFYNVLYVRLDPAAYFGLMALIMAVVAIVFRFVARRFERQEGSAAPGARRS